MPSTSIKGTISSDPFGSSPTARFIFVMNGKPNGTFVANNNVALTPFKSASALFTYDEEAALGGTNAYSGTIGAGKFSVTLEDNSTLTADIVGGPADSQSISGSGNWQFALSPH
ncbi:hypothetical protein M422DRAFT_251132 [Sphaerobolus stellatus SS14]|uniref:Uncharacterized protein n=1 Tax=Sphaerobolus stellatus (strain SS14) TaxID=990650 RepID=A0A0C9VEA1_SPHS4|nr:hypothetical protein M422DRAFT_251132 [Sphaerobolus stellatus SS14]